MLSHFVEHRREVIRRRTLFDLKKAAARAHILEGLRIAVDHIDEVIKLIRASQTRQDAMDGLISRFEFSEIQAKAILEMQLQRLIALEREKLEEEYQQLLKDIEYYNTILSDAALLLKIMKEDLITVRDKFGDKRRTQIVGSAADLEIEDLNALLCEKTRLVCFTHCSNVVGLIHDVKEIVRVIHDAGAWACVDGVAYTPHRRVDVKKLDVDFYLYSPYKVFGPHLGVLYGKRELLAQTANQSHYFLGGDEIQRSLCPGGLNFELTAACAGMVEYFDIVHEHHYPGANVPG